MSRELKLMADYYAWPLWNSEGEDVDPATLPISASLQDRLRSWSDAYAATLNTEDPASSGFSSAAAETEWEAQGTELWNEVRRELGPDFVVTFFSDSRQTILYPPAEETSGAA